MKIKHYLPIEQKVIRIVSTLQNAGFETYIVGGAVRDLLLNRRPKDYDISTSATPEEIREVFGRRKARIIGKRFRLVHLYIGREIYEISTFRSPPSNDSKKSKNDNFITSDNNFGTSSEDAKRRDFTVNAMFYDPTNEEIIDYTKKGLDDIKNGCVRVIGEPKLRFEEDPVRLLRALKLVGQYDFSLEKKTENALFGNVELLKNASSSRLSLEFEKILSSSYSDRHLEVFHDYGLLPYFLPNIAKCWDSEAMDYSMRLLNEKNFRIEEGLYRNSISLAIATMVLPFVEVETGGEVASLWKYNEENSFVIEKVLGQIFKPLTMINRIILSSQKILELQPLFYEPKMKSNLLNSKYYPHARELFIIRALCNGEDVEMLSSMWSKEGTNTNNSRRKHFR